MPFVKWLAAGAISALLLAGVATAQNASVPGASGATATPDLIAASATPYQKAMGEAIASRQAAGLPVPGVEYSFEVLDTAAPAGKGPLLAAPAAPGRKVTVIGRTRVHFDGPAQAGYERWPRLIVRNEAQDGGMQLVEGDYTDAYRDAVARVAPGIWDQYEFGFEPRENVIEETLTLTWPEGSPEAAGVPGPLTALAEGPSVAPILMGFTFTGPHIDYTVGTDWDFCSWLTGCIDIVFFKAGFELDWGLGLRLPAEVDLAGPASLTAGLPAPLSSALSPLDWTADNFTAAGVEPWGGNEWVLRFVFFAGLQAEILGADLCGNCYLSVDVDRNSSFVTPFGSGASFPIPPAQFPVRQFGSSLFSFEVGLQIQPYLGSSRITADWLASGAAAGGGEITYSAPDTPVSLAANACLNGPSHQARFRVENFKYWFSDFLVQLDAYLNIQLFGWGSWTPTVKITDFDLSPLTSGLWVGRHKACNALFNCGEAGPANFVELTAPVVDNAAPTTTVASLSGVAGNHGWYMSDVAVTLNASDNPPSCGSGVQSTQTKVNDLGWMPYAGTFTLSSEQHNTVLYSSADADGNVEPPGTQRVDIDKTPPTITSTVQPASPNGNGWYKENVVVHFEASDATSGIEKVTPDVILSDEAAGQTTTGTATDVAGLSASAAVGGINIDKTPPGIVIDSPRPITYANTGSIGVAWTPSDGLSGIASEKGSVDGAAVTNAQELSLLLFPAGDHQVKVVAVDLADNAGQATMSFFVSVNIDGLIAATQGACGSSLIVKAGICHSLTAKLLAAKAAVERGDFVPARNELHAFLNEMDAQLDKAIEGKAYKVLTADARYVIARLP